MDEDTFGQITTDDDLLSYYEESGLLREFMEREKQAEIDEMLLWW